MMTHPALKIITDAVELAEFKKVLEEKTRAQQEERAALARKANELEYAARYKNKDQSVIPLILKMFEEEDGYVKGRFYSGIKCIITEPEILQYVFADVKNRRYVRYAMAYIIQYWPAGSEAVLKEYLSTRLANINADHLHRIIYLDRYEGILSRIEAEIKDPHSTPQEVHYLLRMLSELYLPSYPRHTVNHISELLSYAYKHQLYIGDEPDQRKFETPLMQCLQDAILSADDERTIALAHELYSIYPDDGDLLLKLIQLEGIKHLDKWHDLLKLNESGADMILHNMDPQLIPEDLLKDMVIRSSRHRTGDKMYPYAGVIYLLQKAGAERLIIEAATYVDNKAWCEQLLAVYAMVNLSPQLIVDDLVTAGLLLQPLTPEVIAWRRANYPSALPSDFMYQAVSEADRFFSYTGSINMPFYEGMFKQFQALSQHVLPDFGFYCHENDVMVITDTAGYILHHECFKTDEEIIPCLMTFMNNLCAERNRPERFIEEGFDFGNYNQYVFADPAKLDWLKRKYDISSFLTHL